MEDEKLRLQQLKVWRARSRGRLVLFTLAFTWHRHALFGPKQEASADPFWLVAQIASKSNLANPQQHWFCQFCFFFFLLLCFVLFTLVARSEAGLPFAGIRFYVSVYVGAALLFSRHSHTGAPTSYFTLLHSPGPHSLNCGENCATCLFSCMQVCTCVIVQSGMWSSNALYMHLFTLRFSCLLIIERISW